jgi:hypothetical protein
MFVAKFQNMPGGQGGGGGWALLTAGEASSINGIVNTTADTARSRRQSFMGRLSSVASCLHMLGDVDISSE